MKKKQRDFGKALAWLILIGVFSVHLFLIKKWCDRNFIHFFTSSSAFLSDLSLVYQAVVGSKCSPLDFSIFAKWSHMGVGRYWPPLPHMINLWILIALPLKWFFLRNFIYLAMIMSGIYAATRFLTQSNLCGALAAAIFSCYPIVGVEMLACEVQLPVTACIVWGFWGYLRSQSFTKFWASAFVGICTVAALYCDRLTPGFFFIPLFLIPANFRKKKSWIFMSLVLIFVICCAWPFYQPWIKRFLDGNFMATLFSQPSTPRVSLSAHYRIVLRDPLFLSAHLSYYFISLILLLGYGFAGLLLLGAAFFQRLKKPEIKVVWFAMIVPLIIFIVIVKKDFVYIFPLCIYFAIITSIGIFLVREKIFQYALVVATIALMVFQCRDLFMPNVPRGALISREMEALSAQNIHLLMPLQKQDYASYKLYRSSPNNFQQQMLSTVDQLKPVLDAPSAPGMPQKVIMVDLWDPDAWRGTVFFLRIFFPKVKVRDDERIKVPDTESRRKFSGDSRQDFFYLLSDKKIYDDENALKNFEEASWKSIEPEYRFPDGRITLYRVKR